MRRSALILVVAVAMAQAGLSEEPPPLLSPGWCSVVEAVQPAGEALAAASTAAAPLPCEGTCAVDVAFSYYPAAIDGGCWWFTEDGLESCPPGYTGRRAESTGELRRYLAEALALVNAAYQASGVNVEFRLFRLDRAGGSRPAGADLWYAVDPWGSSFDGDTFPPTWSGIARLPSRNSAGNPAWPYNGFDGAIRLYGEVYRQRCEGDQRCTAAAAPVYFWSGWPSVIAHEFGHSIGLAHGAEDLAPSVSQWVGGNGFRGRFVPANRANADGTPHEELELYGTIMATWAGEQFARFSSAAESLYGRRIGDRTADASAVLRRNVPYLAARADGAVSVDYGCPPNECVDAAGRFLVGVDYRTADSPHPLLAARLPSAIGANASLFYFFEPNNPEMLLKVLNGCSVNGHWWVYGSAATDLPYTIRLRDLARRNQSEWLAYEHENGLIVGYRIEYVGGGIDDEGTLSQGREIRSATGFSGVGVIADTRAFPCR